MEGSIDHDEKRVRLECRPGWHPRIHAAAKVRCNAEVIATLKVQGDGRLTQMNVLLRSFVKVPREEAIR